jgi:polyhydroxyalkanoate synthesis regulator phasin
MLMEVSRSVEHQFEKQNLWNDDMAQGMETMQGGYQEISALREEVARLREEVKSLSKGSPVTVRRPGRPRRAAE